MHTYPRSHRTRCPLHVSRRSFLASLAASSAALKMGLFDFASEALAADDTPPGKPVIHAAFARPDTDRYWMGWPGAAYDIQASQKLYTRTLREAAKKLGVALQVHEAPLHNTAAADALLEQLEKAKPDGLVLTCMSLNAGWRPINHFVAKKGDLPTVVFSPMGTSFTGHLQPTRDAAKTFVGATQDVRWLAQALRMLKTVWDMQTTRLCIVRGKESVDRPLDVVGTTLRYIPRSRFPQELKKAEASDEVKAIADYYTKEAKKIVEPKPQDILNAATNYVVARRIMRQEKCHGFSMDCLGLVGSRIIPCPPCVAWMRLNDDGSVGACEADWNAAISLRLTRLLCDRPGFMQDPAPNTVSNTLMGAHCSCPSKLAGFDQPHEPFILRSHSESDIGVAPQVLWRVGQKITIMKFQGPGSIIVGTGKVVANIDTPPSGGCRTSVEVEVDDKPDTRDTRGFHQLFIYGDLEDEFRAYGQLAGIAVSHI
ncbi:MAG: hypothetical protein ACOC8A_00750 [bacterium]